MLPDAERERRFEAVINRLKELPLSDQFLPATPATEAEISATEAALGVSLPLLYRRFLREFGPAEIGLPFFSVDENAPQGLVAVRFELQQSRPRLPKNLIPFARDYISVGTLKWIESYLCFDLRRSKRGEYRLTSWRPKASFLARLYPMSETFLEWLEAQADQVEKSAAAYPTPPRDWKNREGWERYWRRVITNPSSLEWERLSNPSSVAIRHREFLTERNPSRLLFAGNGISLEPYAFVHCGFDVTALDISEVASRFVAESSLDAERLSHYFPEFEETPKGKIFHPERSRARRDREHNPGGQLTILTDDFFTHSPTVLYDVVCSNRAFQGFSEEDRRILAGRIFDWLCPGGVALIATMNVMSHRDILENHFRGAGFFIRGTDEAENRRRLDSGEKMVRFLHDAY